MVAVVGLRGDFSKLRALIGRMKAVASGKLERADSALMQEAKAALQLEVAECFLYQRAPDGTAWLARITVYGDFRDTNPILFDLLSSMEYEVIDGAVKATNKKYYAFFHLTPWKRRPARVFLPSRSAPGKLFDRLKLGAVRALRGALTGRGDPAAGYYASYELSRT